MTQTDTLSPAARTPEQISLALQRAKILCDEKGVRFTPIREHVYRALLQSPKPLGAYDILDTLGTVGAQKPPTVYRALDWLMEMGLAQRIATLAKFVPAPLDGSDDPVAYLLCRECGQAETINAGPLAETLNRVAQKSGFRNEETVIEITGLCDDHAHAAA